ncbi:Vacuolar iron transporter 1.1 [Ananas comosus]|uniref:Vacuolar iron transporter n=1 Tax=Ananas comosus TaxID=4615 RepID=A0A199VHB0_ANACO|nr:Vacuolar iron transporter 1.1 [Ananas comosus]
MAMAMGMGMGMAATETEEEKRELLLLGQHKEKHFTAGEVVRDVIMGVSDGLTVPFALAAGLSGADAPSALVLAAGAAEFFTRGRYLAGKSEADHYMREMKREQEEIINVPDTEAAEIGEILSEYGLEPHEYRPVVNALRKNPQAWLEFMMKFELGLEKPDPRRALQSALTIALAYVIGAWSPPALHVRPDAREAMFTSVGVTLAALLFFGYVKAASPATDPS